MRFWVEIFDWLTTQRGYCAANYRYFQIPEVLRVNSATADGLQILLKQCAYALEHLYGTLVGSEGISRNDTCFQLEPVFPTIRLFKKQGIEFSAGLRFQSPYLSCRDHEQKIHGKRFLAVTAAMAVGLHGKIFCGERK